jgi:hypothetical protein
MSVLPKEVAFLLCDRVKREHGTGKAIIDGVFDRVRVKQLPGALNCTLFVRAYYPDGAQVPKSKVRVMLQRPTGQTEQLPEVWVNCTENKIEAQFELQGFLLLHAGRHVFALNVDGLEVGQVRFDVSVAAEQQGVKHVGSEAN